jgi:hypothetical protein
MSCQTGSFLRDVHDAVACLQPGGRGRRTRHHFSDDRAMDGLLFRELPHIHARHDAERQKNIHRWPGYYHHGALPAGFCLEACRIGRVFIARLLTQHAHITAKRNGRNAKIRVPSTPADEPRPEPDAERLNANANSNRGPVVTQFVDHDHDT